MGSLITVTGVLHTEAAARKLRAILAGCGIAHERVSLTLEHIKAARSGACVLSVDVRSARDRRRVEALMAAAGARQARAGD